MGTSIPGTPKEQESSPQHRWIMARLDRLQKNEVVCEGHQQLCSKEASSASYQHDHGIRHIRKSLRFPNVGEYRQQDHGSLPAWAGKDTGHGKTRMAWEYSTVTWWCSISFVWRHHDSDEVIVVACYVLWASFLQLCTLWAALCCPEVYSPEYWATTHWQEVSTKDSMVDYWLPFIFPVGTSNRSHNWCCRD